MQASKRPTSITRPSQCFMQINRSTLRDDTRIQASTLVSREIPCDFSSLSYKLLKSVASKPSPFAGTSSTALFPLSRGSRCSRTCSCTARGASRVSTSILNILTRRFRGGCTFSPVARLEDIKETWSIHGPQVHVQGVLTMLYGYALFYLTVGGLEVRLLFPCGPTGVPVAWSDCIRVVHQDRSDFYSHRSNRTENARASWHFGDGASRSMFSSRSAVSVPKPCAVISLLQLWR